MFYTEKFLHTELEKILDETQLRSGTSIPKPCQKYIIKILTNKIDKNPWQPEPSYAEAYMTVNSTASLLELAETCWFTRAIFPELNMNKGINKNYYVYIGQGCYNRILARTYNYTLEQMITHFELLADITLAAIRQQEITCLKL
jgi:hypothetical protein